MTRDATDTQGSPPRFTVSEAAKRLGTTDEFVRRQIRNGRLAAIDISPDPGEGRPSYRVSPADLDRYVESRAVVPATS